MMWPLSQFGFVTLNFIAYCLLLFILVLSRRLNGLSRAVKRGMVMPPVLSTIVMLTNPYHHLFVKVGEQDFSERVYGPVFLV